MTPSQEKAITLSLNILHVGFFECPRHFYEYFLTNDEWALLMSAAAEWSVLTRMLRTSMMRVSGSHRRASSPRASCGGRRSCWPQRSTADATRGRTRRDSPRADVLDINQTH